MKSSNNILIKLLLPLLLIIPMYFVLPTWQMLLAFVIGLYVGLVIMLADEKWLYKYYVNDNSRQIKLITRSVVFLLTLIPLSLFVVTSTNGVLGWGVILGIWMTILVEMWSLRNSQKQFHKWFLFDLKKKLSADEINYIVLGATGLYVFWIVLLIK